MNKHELATIIAAKVAADAGIMVSVIGILGVTIGAVITVCGTLLLHWLKYKPQRELDSQRAAILTAMLTDDRFQEHWRKLSTLARVVGASEATTKRLLIGIGARSSEKDDGLWGLLKYHSLETTER